MLVLQLAFEKKRLLENNASSRADFSIEFLKNTYICTDLYRLCIYFIQYYQIDCLQCQLYGWLLKQVSYIADFRKLYIYWRSFPTEFLKRQLSIKLCRENPYQTVLPFWNCAARKHTHAISQSSAPYQTVPWVPVSNSTPLIQLCSESTHTRNISNVSSLSNCAVSSSIKLYSPYPTVQWERHTHAISQTSAPCQTHCIWRFVSIELVKIHTFV